MECSRYVIYQSNLPDEIKNNIFQDAVVSISLYGRTAKQEQLKKATSYIIEETSKETAAVRKLTPHL